MSYVGVLERSNPNSHFVVVTDPSTNPPTFQRFFVCFEGVKDGWVGGCKKILCIDGCFLKTFLEGMLLSAVGRDLTSKCIHWRGLLLRVKTMNHGNGSFLN